MKKQTIATLTISILFSVSAFAEYVVKVPVESNIQFVSVNNESNEGAAPAAPFDFSQFNAIGVLNWSQAGGDFSSNAFQTSAYSKVLLRGYGLHSIFLNGDKGEVGEKFTKAIITTQAGTFDCLKNGDASVMWTDYNDGRGTVVETVLNCEVSNYIYSGLAEGQEFSISLQ